MAELLEAYDGAKDLTEAEVALDQLAGIDPPPSLPLGDYYDALAESGVEDGDFALAVRAQRRAIELGCEHRELGRSMLAWYLLKAGEREHGEAAFAELRAERTGDPEIVSTLANARMDSGDGSGALAAYDEALGLARDAGDQDWVDQVRDERRYCRFEQGLPPDEEDRLADEVASVAVAGTHFSVAWFPRDQIEAALAEWPSLSGDLVDPDAYCGAIEERLHEVRDVSGRLPSVAPLDVAGLVELAEAKGVEPDSGLARKLLAADLTRRGLSLPWPPERNELCWCGSGRKYKRCCG